MNFMGELNVSAIGVEAFNCLSVLAYCKFSCETLRNAAKRCEMLRNAAKFVKVPVNRL